MEQTVGGFLKEKIGNMSRWLTVELGKENIDINVEQIVERLSPVEVTYLAELLNTNSALITHKDWSGLVRHLEIEVPEHSFTEIVQIIRAREDLHDKFWRYMKLFSDTVQKSDA